MSTSKLIFSLLGSSVLGKLHPVRFTNKLLRFNFRYTSYCSAAVLDSGNFTSGGTQLSGLPLQIVHIWPEWVNFVDFLKSKGYLTGSYTTTTTGDTPPPLSAALSGGDEAEDAIAYTDIDSLKHACLSFARDRFDIFKSLSRQEMRTILEKGCPDLLRKVVSSAKRLRAHLQLDEGEVCGACNLRRSCDGAYVILKDSEASARTVDIMRVLLHYALHPTVLSGMQMSRGREDIEASARKLLSELIELSETIPVPEPSTTSTPEAASQAGGRNRVPLDPMSENSYRNVEMKRGDWMCPQCNFLNFARNMRCLKCSTEGPKRVADDTEMKKGDWKCPECGFITFASKTKCFRCSEPRPKRQLNPGEWECPSCDFLNYRRNVVCKKCNCVRPTDVERQYEQQIWNKPFSNKF